MSLKVRLSIGTNEVQVHENIVKVDFVLISLGIPLAILIDCVAKFLVHLAKLHSILTFSLRHWIVIAKVVLWKLVPHTGAHARVSSSRGAPVVIV